MTCGKWELAEEIGRGAYGVVHRAMSPDGEHAAVKVCRRDDVGEERYARELRGAKIFKSLPPQEGLVRMREFAETDWGFYTVLDLADDEFEGPLSSSEGYRPKTLSRVIAGEKALPLAACVELAISLANGLAALQRHHLLHRDVKPGNVLYVGGRPVLSDPGLLIEESDAVSLVGTPGYVPPERFTDAASDIYSLGLTLKAASFGRQVEDLDKGPAIEADTGAASFPVWWRILNKATDPVASRRYQSAKALLKDLQALRWRMAFSAFARRWIVAAAIAVAAVVIALCAITFKSKADFDDFVDKANQAREETAERVLADFIDRQTKKEMPKAARGIRAAQQAMLNFQRGMLAHEEREIAVLEDRLAENEKSMKEAERRGDKAGKDDVECGLASVMEQLKLAKKRRDESMKDISAAEEKLKEMDAEVRSADEELLKLKGSK